MRDALSLLDQAIAYGAGKVEETFGAEMLGAVDRGYLFSILNALTRGDGRPCSPRATAWPCAACPSKPRCRNSGPCCTG